MAATANAIEQPNVFQPSLREEPALEGQRSFWELSAPELLERVASAELTPGGGSVPIMVACMGTALLRKALAVSLNKERRAGDRRHPLETALKQLEASEATLHDGAERDASAFVNYVRALRLPHDRWSETRMQEKGREEALVRASSMPITAASEMRNLFQGVLNQLPLIHDVVLSDAIIGLRLLNSAAECLLLTAESNLAKLANPVFQATMGRQIRGIRHSTRQAESQLACRLRSRKLTRPSLQN
jgi:methenyltetrahydrofolate cyclohydrolase